MRVFVCIVVFGVIVALLLPHYRYLFLKIPKYGFIAYLVSGGRAPVNVDYSVWEEDNLSLWLTRPNRDRRYKNVVVSACSKCGTTYTLQLLHKIRMKGEDLGDYENDLLLECPWMEYKLYRSQTLEERIQAHWKTLTTRGYPYQCFKSHVPPPDARVVDDALYVVVLRNPLDTIESFKRMLKSLDPSWIEHFGGFGDGVQETETYYKFLLTSEIAPEPFYKEYVNFAKWLPHCHKKNVLCLHYADMRKEPEETVKKLVDFVGMVLTKEQRANVLKHSSIEFMKKHHHRYEHRVFSQLQLFTKELEFINEGKVNKVYEDKLMESKRKEMEVLLRQDLPPNVIEYYFNGGKVPSL